VRGRRPGQRHDHRAAVLSVSSNTVVVQGRELTFPIEIRAARSWAASYLVPAEAAQRIVGDARLPVARVFPGRTILTLTFVRYEDGDLDAYNEVGVVYLVNGPGGRGVYVHHLPVNQGFTLAAGREIWGYPKFLADIDIEESDRSARCTLRHDGAEVLRLMVRPGSLPTPQPSLPTYTNLDGTLRKTSWELQCKPRGRFFGGASLQLGRHPIADELRSLGLPKRAFMTTISASFRSTFGPAEVL
jgi:hypothetical protein